MSRCKRNRVSITCAERISPPRFIVVMDIHVSLCRTHGVEVSRDLLSRSAQACYAIVGPCPCTRLGWTCPHEILTNCRDGPGAADINQDFSNGWRLDGNGRKQSAATHPRTTYAVPVFRNGGVNANPESRGVRQRPVIEIEF